MAVFVKICGLTSRADVQAVAAAGPDALGFVFWGRSPRGVSPDAVRRWTVRLPEGMLRVGVFVDATAAEVQAVRAEAGLDIVQLHGSETTAAVQAIGGRIWRALPAEPAFDPGPWIESGVDAFVLDSASGPMPGGTGRTCDWAVAADAVRRTDRPVLLAGGLSPENVRNAVADVRPWGVDVSSGVELAPGRKDPERVRRFIEQCRDR